MKEWLLAGVFARAFEGGPWEFGYGFCESGLSRIWERVRWLLLWGSLCYHLEPIVSSRVKFCDAPLVI